MRYTLTFFLVIATALSFAQSFYQLENIDIPDDGTSIMFEMNVSGLPTTIDGDFGLESVCFNINHTWDSDIDVLLIAPDGSSFVLVSGVGWAAVNFENTCFNSFADVFISDGIGPFTGEWKPIGDMGAVNNGQNPNGIWKLYVYDTWAFADAGFMIDWSITFGDNPAIPFPFYSSNLPIVKINTLGAIMNEPKTEANFYIIDGGMGATNIPSDTNYAFEGKILVELQGFSGPYYPKKNYDFDIVDDAGLEYDTVLLGLPSENDFILKAEYLDYSLMKNAITYEMYRKMGRYAPRTKYCEVMVNGEYKGVYSLTEKIKRDENRVDIAQLNPEDISGEELTGGYIFEINENFTPNDWESDYLPINYASCGLPVAYKMVYPRVEEIQPEQLDYIVAYVDSFEDALYGDEFLDEANGYRNFISVKSFVDFLITNEFSANYDSYGRSTFLYKDKNGEINIGPAWDYDRAFAPWDVSGWVWENTHPAWPFPFWWDRLQDDEEWRNEVYCRYNDVRQHILTDENITAFIDSVDAYIGDAAARNFLKWQELGVGDPEYFVTELRDFIDARLNWMDITLAADFVPAPDASFTITELGALTYAFTPVTANADYLWDFGDGIQSTEENPTHTFSGTGDYIVSLTVNKYYGCIGNSNEMFQANVSTADMSLDGITIFPNPATDFIQIGSNNNVVINETALFTVEGKYIETNITTTSNGIVINLKNVAAGTYLLKIKSGETLINYPFIKY